MHGPTVLAVLFTTPMTALLTTAAVAAIPVTIHFFNRRRYNVVNWAAMRFLQAAIKRTTRRLRLEQLLLLAVRTLLIVLPLLAMATAMPWAESTWRRLFPNVAGSLIPAGQTHHVLVIDASLSMSAQRDDGSAFERAQSSAKKIVQKSPGGDAFSVLTISAPSKVIVPGPANDTSRVIREIDELSCTHGRADLSQALHFVEEALSRQKERYAHHMVYFITDLQRSQWLPSNLNGAGWQDAWQSLHEHADVAVVDVGTSAGENLAITHSTVDDSFITVGSQVAVTATIHNFGPRDRKQVPVELRQIQSRNSGTRDQVLRQELVDIPAGAEATVSFPAEFLQAGEFLLEVRLPADSLPGDDRRGIGIQVRDHVPVLLVNGRPANDLFATATGWLAAALNPFGNDLSTRKNSPSAAQPRVIDAARLADPELSLNSYDCIYMCDVARPSSFDVERFESYVSRGGTLVVVLGPNCEPSAYQRLLPARLSQRNRAAEGQYFTLSADDDAFRRPPLAAFAADDDRASLLAARFKEYWQIETTAKPEPRRVLSFASPATFGDALIYEWSRGRGRLVLVTSTMNTEWNSWPIAPSFVPFVHELLRSTVRAMPRRDLIVGDAIDEFLPENTSASEAKVALPDGSTTMVPIVTGEEWPRLRFTNTELSGVYSIQIAGQPDRIYAVNVPGGESDLRRATISDLPSPGTGDDPQIVSDPGQVARRRAQATDETTLFVTQVSETGSHVARWILLAALLMLLIEPCLAWRFGSARGPTTPVDRVHDTAGRRVRSLLIAVSTALPILVVMSGAFALLHAAVTGEFLSFMPQVMRSHFEHALNIPQLPEGEAMHWRLDRFAVISNDPELDRWLTGGIAVLALVVMCVIYWRELRQSSRLAGGPLVILRIGTVLLTLLVLLPQLRMVFESEGQPQLAILIDNSQSMSAATDTEAPGTHAPMARIQAAKSLLNAGGQDWLAQLSRKKHNRLHVFVMSDTVTQIAEIDADREIDEARSKVAELQAIGQSSRLGDAVRTVLQEFRGAALGGIVVLTDGITTDGDDLVVASRHASRAGVPLYLIGIGDSQEPADISLSNLTVDDIVHVGDRIVFEATLTTRGNISGNHTVSLSEKNGDQFVPLGQQVVNLTGSPSSTKIRLTHTPKEPGDRVYVLSVPATSGETDQTNNRLERTITVEEFKRSRVLYIEARPRYDFRYVKTLFERESEAIRGNKSIDLKVLLTDADVDYARQDRTALDAFPSSREDLFSRFDAIILGDVRPDNPQLGELHLQWIADFVKEKGGGLLALAGPMAMPHAYKNTPLAALLPVTVDSNKSSGAVQDAGYRLTLTPIGRSHPAFRLAPSEQENTEIWTQLRPMLWHATGLTPKPAAEVLATGPTPPLSNTGEPLVLQQFVGAGRVIYLGFEESWRWRFRGDEIRFNQFWIQMVRYLVRIRPSRPEIYLDRQTAYRRGEPIRVSVRFPEDRPPPPAETVVRVQLERTPPQGPSERQALQLSPVPNARGTFDTIVSRTPDGQYRFTLSSNEGRSPMVEARVLPPPGEMDRLRMNRSDMERAAELTHGKFLTFAEATRLPDEIPPLPRVTLHQPRPPLPLWNSPLVVGLGVCLLVGEWLLRKRQQLV